MKQRFLCLAALGFVAVFAFAPMARATPSDPTPAAITLADWRRPPSPYGHWHGGWQRPPAPPRYWGGHGWRPPPPRPYWHQPQYYGRPYYQPPYRGHWRR